MKDNKSYDKLKPIPNITTLVTGRALEEAYAWVLEQRKNHSANNSIWHLLGERVQCPILINLVRQYCERVEIREGEYYHFKKGIPMGCPLSPLMAALYLKPLDDALRPYGKYVRFMDDWLIMVKTKRMLRKVIKITHRVLNALQLKMHPDKTFLGCIKKGFDFLGVHFGDAPKISRTSVENHQTRLGLRYAQHQSPALIGRYRARWTSRCTGLLKSCLDSSNNRSGDKTLVTSRCKELLKDDYYEHLQYSNKTRQALPLC